MFEEKSSIPARYMMHNGHSMLYFSNYSSIIESCVFDDLASSGSRIDELKASTLMTSVAWKEPQESFYLPLVH